MQCYRHMRIGTAAPAAEVLNRIPHHLIDFLSPDQQYTVAHFVQRAEEIIADLHHRQRWAVVCGGSGYYILRLLCGLPTTPTVDIKVRRALQRRAHQEGLAVLYRELQEQDARYAATISAHDRYRILRALEIIQQSGRPVSAHRLKQQIRTDWNILLVGLTSTRAELRERITARVADMFAHGLVAELHDLVARGYGPTDSGLRAIGYRQFFNADGTLRDTANADVRHAIQQEIISATLKYAKRQRTFFRQLKEAHWFSPSDWIPIGALINDFLSQNLIDVRQ